MLEVLSNLLKSKFDYTLNDYAIYEIHNGKNRVRLVSTILFVIVLLLFILDVTAILPNFVSLGTLIVLFAVFIVAPYSLVKSKYQAIIVTPKYLIERVSKSDFVVIEFDKVTDFKISKDGCVVKEGNKKVMLCTKLFQEEVDPIIEILEAKGKTFDKEKDYMIRNIKIIIQDNKVYIEDDETITEAEKLYERFHNEFPVLTPGFIDEILFRNSAVEDVLVDGGHIFIYLDSVDVKGGHPENTTFDNLRARDCILIFEKIQFHDVYRKDLNDKSKPIEELSTEPEEVVEYLEKAVIHEWKNSGKKMKMVFAEGVHMLHTEFSYDEAIVGWKEAK